MYTDTDLDHMIRIDPLPHGHIIAVCICGWHGTTHKITANPYKAWAYECATDEARAHKNGVTL